MSKLTGKVAVVTGASKGIGAAIAKSLAASGASVVVNYASSKAGADVVVNEIVSKGGKAIAIQGDVSKSADVKRLFSQASEAYGDLDILVNNAGVYKFVPLADVDEDEFHRQFNTNVLGPLLATREALKYFRPAGANVINISSGVSTNPMADTSIYAATKAALDNITVGLSRELAGRNIRVNSILPGATVTEGVEVLGMLGTDFEKALVAATPLGRMGQPDDIARVAVFLASDDAAWLTGERISASGGWR